MKFYFSLFLSVMAHGVLIWFPVGKKQDFFFEEVFSSHAIRAYLKDLDSFSAKKNVNRELKEKIARKLIKEDKVLRKGKRGSLTGAKPIGHLKPLYPFHSHRLGHQGVVVVSAHIDKRGKAHNIFIVKSSGFLDLDREAKRVLEEAQFSPAVENGVIVSIVQEFTFRFELQ